jgi:hypothetical protein
VEEAEEHHIVLDESHCGKRSEEVHLEEGSCKLVGLPYLEAEDLGEGDKIDPEEVVEVVHNNFDGSYGIVGLDTPFCKSQRTLSR